MDPLVVIASRRDHFRARVRHYGITVTPITVTPYYIPNFVYPSVMARLARIVVPGLPHHVTQRGNRREVVFRERVGRNSLLRRLGAEPGCTAGVAISFNSPAKAAQCAALIAPYVLALHALSSWRVPLTRIARKRAIRPLPASGER